MKHTRRSPHRIRTRKSVFKKPGFWIFLGIVAFISTLLYFLLFLDYFQVKTINVFGNEKVSAQDIQSVVLKEVRKNIIFFESKSIFLASLDRINTNIRKEFPEINIIKTKRKLFDTVLVTIEERAPVLVLCGLSEEKNLCYYLDNKGVAFEKMNGGGKGLTIVRQDGSNTPDLGVEVLSPKLTNQIIEIEGSIGKNIGIKEVNILSDERMDVETAEGWSIYFSLVNEMGLQLTKLNLLLEKEISKDERNILHYIDLRFQDRAYYK